MGDAEVVVGSLMLTFDKAMMARVLKVPTEKMRDKVFQSLEQYMTTMQEQLATLPNRAAVKQIYVERCAAALGVDIVPGELTAAERAAIAAIAARFQSDEWLYARGVLTRRFASGQGQTGVKIHEDVRVAKAAFKAPGGPIRATARLVSGIVDDAAFTGDFTLLPAVALDALEPGVCGLPLDRAALTMRLGELYTAHAIRSPGVTPEHFAEAVMLCAGNSASVSVSGG